MNVELQNDIEYISKTEKVSMHDDWFDIATSSHFWLQWRFEILKRFKNFLPDTGGEILEIGCGNGVVLEQLSGIGYQVDGCDLNEHALRMVDHVKGRVMLYNIYDKHPDLLEKYDLVLLMDVIEHIEDDVDFVKTAKKYIKPGGRVLINVPAGDYLFGKYDKEVGHLRRYSRASLKRTLEKAGLTDIKISYWAFSLIPLALLRKLMHTFKKDNVINSGMKPPGMIMHRILKMIKRIELTIFKFPPIGASVMGGGRK